LTRYLHLFVCLVATLCMEGAFAQALPTQTYQSVQNSTSSSPVAYVYVSGQKTAGVNEIYAFAAASSGKLTRVSGSPFPGNIASMAVNGKYLFGSSDEQTDISSFSIAPDGALKQAASIDGRKYNGYDCGGPGPLFLDHTGATLYDLDFLGNICANNTYQSFRIEKTAGELDYLGSDGEDPWFNVPLSFIGNNTYAYGAVCLNDMYWEIYGFKRHSDGMLIQANVSAPTPTPKEGDFYCPNLTATDSTNHVAISLQAVDGETFNPDGPPQLATYTAEDSGNLETKSTRENMPETAVENVTDVGVSPSGKLLAVGGTAGLQIFHFNGSDPVTPYTERLTKDEVDQFFWDNDNHLYAISQSGGKLFVFTITPTQFSQAAGSPYSISNPQDIIVLPKT
jgi:WD40 repeat protein